MRIFLSHSGRQKPLIREIRKYLPEHLGTWIDEGKLLFGDSIEHTLQSTIATDTDYVILFVDEYAVRSSWVLKEVQWALEAEKRHHRVILLLVVLDDGALEQIQSVELRARKYLQLKDFHEHSVRALSELIASEVFALVCREIDQLRHPNTRGQLTTLSNAQEIIRSQAELIQKIVFPHRKSNPIPTERLLAVMNTHNGQALTLNEFEELFSKIVQQNLVPGLSYDGTEAYLVEEHASWKANVEHAKKQAIGRKAAQLIKNGSKVLIDAGSTAEEIVKVICKKIENRLLTRIVIGTTSINIADMVSDCCVRMGFDDEFSAVRLFVPGGQIRPNTQAIVPAFGTELRQIRMMAESLGGFDICFVGVNAVTSEGGLNTHSNTEAQNKVDLLDASKTRIVVGDSSKVGLVLDCQFASLDHDVKLIVDNDGDNKGLQEIIEKYRDKILIA